MSRYLLPVLGLGAAMTICTPVLAAGADDQAQVVKYTYADLHTAEGAKALALRIRIAAAKACGDGIDFFHPNSTGFVECREAAIDKALQGLDAPLVAQALGRGQTALAGSH